ncbi:hypothetical protein CAPTEDRAFT_204264 [Capitella teleta]|uniref:CARD domain-containing protein n=1 Tax=Capitella teleta TaxID=283909 RepID=R7V4P3_CAPTE|nr:hypothetical protein CAPTEDRAFT_204264 [Capitella teleta]|eukprot:ELU10735.1 hypothetical protein CAPTEDRAFT_204264 [Capitella teleta]
MRRVLQGLWVSLKDGLKYTTGHIADHLYQDGIITIDFKGELASKTGTEKTELLLNFIRETPAEQIQRFFDLLQSENKFLYENSVKMKKKFEEDAAALEQSAEIPATQPCPVSSSSFTGARYPSSQSPVGLSTPSTESHEETFRKTEPFEEKFKKAEPFEETLKKTDEIPCVKDQVKVFAFAFKQDSFRDSEYTQKGFVFIFLFIKLHACKNNMYNKINACNSMAEQENL